jgi:hypothetical protein
MGLRPTQGDEKHLLSTNRSPWKHRPPLCHPERSRGICGSADHSWECFSTERSAVEGPAVDPRRHQTLREAPPTLDFLLRGNIEELSCWLRCIRGGCD